MQPGTQSSACSWSLSSKHGGAHSRAPVGATAPAVASIGSLSVVASRRRHSDREAPCLFPLLFSPVRRHPFRRTFPKVPGQHRRKVPLATAQAGPERCYVGACRAHRLLRWPVGSHRCPAPKFEGSGRKCQQYLWDSLVTEIRTGDSATPGEPTHNRRPMGCL